MNALLEFPGTERGGGQIPGKDGGNWIDPSCAYLKERGFQPFGSNLLLAVSGGMDSMCLLHFWNTVGRRMFGCGIAVVHVDHNLRKGSGRDKTFVETICRDADIPFHCAKLLPSGRGAGLSEEMWGRHERYRIFQELCAEHKYHWVLTAHHLDDQVETLFLRLGRGTGIQGLQGILFRRRPNIIRPFLNRTREDLRKYARSNALQWKEDSSNRDIRYERNWYRLQYLPKLKGEDRNLVSRVSSITGDLQRLWPKIESWLNGDIALDGKGTHYVPLHNIRRNVLDDEGSVFETLSLLAEKSGTALSEPAFREFMNQKNRNSREIGVHINERFTMRMNGSRIWFEPSKLEKDFKNAKYSEIALDISRNKTQFKGKWGDKRICVQALRYPKPGFFQVKRKKGYKAFLDGDKLSSTLLMRTRKKGDKFSPLGTSAKHRKLKSYLIGIKLPAERRDTQLLVCSPEEIVWIPPFEISEFYRITTTTKQILELEIECLN